MKKIFESIYQIITGYKDKPGVEVMHKEIINKGDPLLSEFKRINKRINKRMNEEDIPELKKLIKEFYESKNRK